MGEQHHAGIIPLSIGAIFDYVEDVSTYTYNVYTETLTQRCLVITMPVDVHVCVQPWTSWQPRQHILVGNFEGSQMGRKIAFGGWNFHWMLNQSYRWCGTPKLLGENFLLVVLKLQSFLPWKFTTMQCDILIIMTVVDSWNKFQCIDHSEVSEV